MRLLPEWAPQEAVILAWPDPLTDWQPWLPEVRRVYLQIIELLNQAQTPVILLIREAEIKVFQTHISPEARVLLVKADYNDTWVRDYAFLSCNSAQGMQALEFTFNGWGNKFDAGKDNQINQDVLARLCHLPLKSIDIVAEGGALEIDQHGHLLSTQFCLCNPQRNGKLSLDQYRQIFQQQLGATRVSVFENGHLAGDDTDGHIDTLVRFTPDKGLVIQSAYNRPADEHFSGLAALVQECQAGLPEHTIFELPLPLVLNQQGERLPASYANFLISNQQLLCPVYGEAEDQRAINILTLAYPEHKIVPIDCLPLIQQFGSLHCITMQVPVGILRPDVVHKFSHGVSQL
ncbi:MAG: agmatine deiminase [Paraglaciecola sp.]|jgi:agmatine deiminase